MFFCAAANLVCLYGASLCQVCVAENASRFLGYQNIFKNTGGDTFFRDIL